MRIEEFRETQRSLLTLAKFRNTAEAIRVCNIFDEVYALLETNPVLKMQIERSDVDIRGNRGGVENE